MRARETQMLGQGPSPDRLRLLTAGLVAAAALLFSQPSRADQTIAINTPHTQDAVSGAAPSISDLRTRYGGSFRYAGDAREQQARRDAIERAVATFFFAVRGAARSSIDGRTRIMPTCKFEFGGGKITSIVPGHAPAISLETGAPAPYRVEDDAIVLTQRFDGARLIQSFRADEGGTRRNEFTVSADGKLRFMKATLSSPKLSVPVVYTLTYRRVD